MPYRYAKACAMTTGLVGGSSPRTLHRSRPSISKRDGRPPLSAVPLERPPVIYAPHYGSARGPSGAGYSAGDGHRLGCAHVRPLQRAAARLGLGRPCTAPGHRARRDFARRGLRNRARHRGAACARAPGARAGHRRVAGSASVRCGARYVPSGLDEPVDAIISTARCTGSPTTIVSGLRLAGALRPGGVLEVQCGGEGNIARRRSTRSAARRGAGAGRLVAVDVRRAAGDGAAAARRGLHRDPVLAGGRRRPTPLRAHVAAGVRRCRDYVRLNVSAVRQ